MNKPRNFSFNPDEHKGAPEAWRGAWPWGVDFAEGVHRVIAVHLGGSKIKYGFNWMGPIILTNETSSQLEKWAERVLSYDGGYVHLLPADGDASEELREYIEERELDEDS
jgi:hypothetical protein